MVRGRKAAPASSRRGRKKAPPLPIGAVLTVPSPSLTGEVASRAEPRWTALLSPGLPLVLSALNCAHLELGLAVVVVARRVRPAIVCAHFVIDLLACGVTDCYGEAFAEPAFEKYLCELDERVPLESCPPEVAARIVCDGISLGERNGVVQPESLASWSLLLPPPAPGASPISYLVDSPARPLAVAEILALRPRGEGVWLGEDHEIRCVVRVEGRREH